MLSNITLNLNGFFQVKAVYKKCLSSYEIFYRTLGVTMLNHTPSSRKDRGRSLIRDKDRTTPINPPTLEKEEDSPGHDKKEESNRRRSDKKRLNHVTVETSDREVDNSESKDSGKTGKDRTDSKSRKDKKKGEKVKTLIEKFEEHAKKAEDDKVIFQNVVQLILLYPEIGVGYALGPLKS